MTAAIGYRDEDVFAHMVERRPASVACQILFIEDLVDDEDLSVRTNDKGDLEIRLADRHVILAHGTPIYHRMFSRRGVDAKWSQRYNALQAAFSQFVYASHPASLIMNRPSAGACNSSKPAHQRKLSGHGFDIPDWIVTADRQSLIRFAERHVDVINKGISGVRTIARRVSVRDLENASANVPVMLQRLIPGYDVRFHKVGVEGVALRIDSSADDYRYAHRSGASLQSKQIDVPPHIELSCWSYMRDERLEFAGFDFKVDDIGRWWLLEANPMPGYSFFDDKCDGRISAMLWRALARGYSNLTTVAPTESFIAADRRPGVQLA